MDKPIITLCTYYKQVKNFKTPYMKIKIDGEGATQEDFRKLVLSNNYEKIVINKSVPILRYREYYKRIILAKGYYCDICNVPFDEESKQFALDSIAELKREIKEIEDHIERYEYFEIQKALDRYADEKHSDSNI